MLLEIESAAFPQDLRYSREHFDERMGNPGAELLVIRACGGIMGFALSYNTPWIVPDAIFLDDLAIRPEQQGKGLGSAMLSLIASLVRVRGQRAIYLSAERSGQLTKFYQRSNFRVLTAFAGIGQVLYKEVSMCGPDNFDRIQTVLSEFACRLKRELTSPRITLHTILDPELLGILLSLEAVFPESLRFTIGTFHERMLRRDAYVLLVREQNTPVAYSLSFSGDGMPGHAMYLDSMSVRPEFQRRGIGSVLMEAMLSIPALGRYTSAIFHCRKRNHDGMALPEFYSRFGAVRIDESNGTVRMLVPLKTRAAESSAGTESSSSRGAGPPAMRRETMHSSTGAAAFMLNGTSAGNGNGHREIFTVSEREEAFGIEARNGEPTVADLPFLGRAVADRLAQQGIHTISDFLGRAGPRECRLELEEMLGLPVGALAPAAHFADMTRSGIAARHLSRLNRHRLRTLASLSESGPGRLRKVLPASVPDDEVERVSTAARFLTSLVED
ncbi:MAG: GNAT family N-acetyltransferase [Bryobacteraceae bacterium]